MNIRDEKGAITIYLTIIFLAVLALVGGLVDGARIRVGETQVGRATESAIMSSLAGYYGPLKEDYGLFSLGYPDEDTLRNDLEDYLKKNLIPQFDQEVKVQDEESGFIDLFQYKLDDMELERVHNLTENIVLENQIIEFMKFRAPIELVDYIRDHSIIDKLEQVKKISNTSKVINKKIDFDELVGELGLLQNDLSQAIDSLNKGFTDTISIKLMEYEEAGLDYIEDLDRNSADEENPRRPDDRYKERKFSLLLEALEDRKNLNEDVVDCASRIERLLDKIKTSIEENKRYIKENREDLAKDFLDNFEKEIKELESILKVEGNQSTEIKKMAGENINYIEQAISKLRNINNNLENLSAGQFIEEIRDVEDKLYQDYNNINYTIKTIREDYDYSNLDDRDKVNKELKKMKEEDEDNKDYNEISKGMKEKLPSFKDSDGTYPNKIITDTVDTNNWADEIEEIDTEKEYSVGKSGKYKKDDMDSTRDILKDASLFGDAIGGSILELRDELYINEYIMGMFTNAVPELVRSDMKYPTSTKVYRDTITDLQNRHKIDDRGAYFENGEVEYIIFGREKEKQNIMAMKSSLFGIRTAANLITIYTIPSKVSNAQNIAVSVSTALAATSFGSSAALVPVIKNSILAGWAMAESVVDVRYLMEGRSIPAVKTKDNWITGWDSPNALKKGEEDPLALSYHDYLRLFLLMKSRDSTINKLQDLIQLNLVDKVNGDFMLKNYYTYVGLRVDVSMRYLFMTQAFMPKSKVTEDGKHRIRSIIYQGY